MKFKKLRENLFVILILGVFVLWALSGILTLLFLNQWSDRGTFGDLFGSVNALFSGLAFAALIYTIVLQREEIKSNREEIILNRKELAKGAKLQQKAQQLLTQQVKETHLSAKMNAMRTLVDYYNNQISNPKSNEATIENARTKRKNIIHLIDELIDGLDDSEVD